MSVKVKITNNTKSAAVIRVFKQLGGEATLLPNESQEFNALELRKGWESVVTSMGLTVTVVDPANAANIQAEQDKKNKDEADRKAKEEHEAKLKAEHDAKVKADEEAKLKAESDAKAKKVADDKLAADKKADQEKKDAEAKKQADAKQDPKASK